MAETADLFPDQTPKSIRDLCLEVNLSKQRVWKLINQNRVPAPLKVSTRKWVYSPQGFRAAVAAIQSGRQDLETQRVMRHRMRLRRELERVKAHEERVKAQEAKVAAYRASLQKRLLAEGVIG
jgi:hypothetical protein